MYLLNWITILYLESPVKKNLKKEDVDKYQFNSISEDGTKMYFKKLSDKATTPLRASRNAAGKNCLDFL